MKLLVGYKSGTNQAENLLELAIRHASAFNAEVFVVSVLEEGTEKDLDVIEEAESALETAKSHFDRKKIPCETRLLIRGNGPAKELVDFAGKIEADEILIGVINKTMMEKLLLGSTSQEIILNAPCPVLSMK